MRSGEYEVRCVKCDVRNVVFILLFLFAAGAFAQDEASPPDGGAFGPPFMGRIKADKVNVRSGPNKNFEALAKADRGELVFCRQERYGWYEIQPPEGVSFYVSKEYIDRINKYGVSTAGKLNVRSRPSVDSSVTGQLKRYQAVRIIEELSNWYRIVPPAGSSAWVRSDLVEFYSHPDERQDKEDLPAQPPEDFTRLEDMHSVSLKRSSSWPRLRLAKLLDDYKEFISSRPPEPYRSLAVRTAGLIEAKISGIAVEGAGGGVSSAGMKDEDGRPFDVPYARGAVKKVYSLFKKPAHKYKLMQEGKFICYLKSAEIALDEFRDMHVFVWGDVSDMDGKKIVLEVTKIKKCD